MTALVDATKQLPLDVRDILQQLIFIAAVVSVVKADKPPRVDAFELVINEAFDIPFKLPGLLLL